MYSPLASTARPRRRSPSPTGTAGSVPARSTRSTSALEGGDDPRRPPRTWRRCWPTSRRRAPVADLHQVHGATSSTSSTSPTAGGAPTRDGAGHHPARRGAVVRVADCVPVAARRPRRRVVGAAHAGRPGLAAGVVPATVAAMRDAGRRPRSSPGSARTSAAAATRCRRRCGTRSAPSVPAASPRPRGAPRPLDLGAGVRAQLDGSRRRPSSTCRRCTRESDDLYSYRRDGAAAGRLAGLVRLRRPVS